MTDSPATRAAEARLAAIRATLAARQLARAEAHNHGRTD
jgi:hypothetical protein